MFSTLDYMLIILHLIELRQFIIKTFVKVKDDVLYFYPDSSWSWFPSLLPGCIASCDFTLCLVYTAPAGLSFLLPLGFFVKLALMPLQLTIFQEAQLVFFAALSTVAKNEPLCQLTSTGSGTHVYTFYIGIYGNTNPKSICLAHSMKLRPHGAVTFSNICDVLKHLFVGSLQALNHRIKLGYTNFNSVS